jgi:hypothetical protein
MDSMINKQKSNEMHLDCLLYHLIPPTCFGRNNYLVFYNTTLRMAGAGRNM